MMDSNKDNNDGAAPWVEAAQGHNNQTEHRGKRGRKMTLAPMDDGQQQRQQ